MLDAEAEVAEAGADAFGQVPMSDAGTEVADAGADAVRQVPRSAEFSRLSDGCVKRCLVLSMSERRKKCGGNIR